MSTKRDSVASLGLAGIQPRLVLVVLLRTIQSAICVPRLCDLQARLGNWAPKIELPGYHGLFQGPFALMPQGEGVCCSIAKTELDLCS